MKTPDEIKKGLECCLGDCHNYHCEECPYMNPDTEDYDGCSDNGKKLAADALALIQQLEEEKARLDCTITLLAGTVKHLRETAPRWISVKDRLPADYQEALVIFNYELIAVRFFCHGKWYSNGYEEKDTVTHWMPLPEPPKE